MLQGASGGARRNCSDGNGVDGNGGSCNGDGNTGNGECGEGDCNIGTVDGSDSDRGNDHSDGSKGVGSSNGDAGGEGAALQKHVNTCIALVKRDKASCHDLCKRNEVSFTRAFTARVHT